MVEKEVKMKVFEKNKGFKVINGNSLEVLDTLEPNSIDAIITDPPYGLTTITKRFGKENSAACKYGKDGSFARLSKGFMGKEWDGSGIEYNVELWAKALRVLKSGGYLLAFGGTRTYHRIACAIEDAGFEIRDCIMWLYGSGFPKSLNIGLAIDKKLGIESIDTGEKISSMSSLGVMHDDNWVSNKDITRKQASNEWEGWGTSLKPAYEPIIVARKPVEGSVADNVLKYRVGGININECRVGEVGGVKKVEIEPDSGSKNCGFGCNGKLEQLDLGRFPANVILTYDETDKEEVIGGMPETNGAGGSVPNVKVTGYGEGIGNGKNIYTPNDRTPFDSGSGSAARYFYCAKASKKDRDAGLIEFETKQCFGGGGGIGDYLLDVNSASGKFGSEKAPGKNIHPTVKPVELMQYLVRLVSPKGATILDIFNGSGSTGKAVAFENRERDANYKYIGIELDKEYCQISESRIDYALNKYKYDILEEVEENKKIGQLSLFDYNNEEGEKL